jgi:hypothetical protein
MIRGDDVLYGAMSRVLSSSPRHSRIEESEKGRGQLSRVAGVAGEMWAQQCGRGPWERAKDDLGVVSLPIVADFGSGRRP